ncbi:MAG: (5-formylfuran-3-yl)methyl phosphate synthase [Gammaproteobacteria bacterium]
MTQMLASVTGAAEAALAIEAGADVVDLKNPASGALGALPLAVLCEVVAAHGGRRPLSATIGDLPPEPERVVAAASEVGATGVDYVKVGLFGTTDESAARLRTVEALGALAREGVALVGVLMADTAPDFGLVAGLARAGFAGVMLDTERKPRAGQSRAGRPVGLRAALSDVQLAAFVQTVHEHGLLAGLAGSLAATDVEPLLALGPDILGFRGALCEGGRGSALSPERMAGVRQAIPLHGSVQRAYQIEWRARRERSTHATAARRGAV